MSSIRDHIQSLVGHYVQFGDGNLNRARTVNDPPDLVIMGVGSKGATYEPLAFNSNSIDNILPMFGAEGDLTRQVQEMQAKGVNSALVQRIGGRAPFLMHIGGSNSITGQEDGLWVEFKYGGKHYNLGAAYDHTSGRLIIDDKDTNTILFDNDPTNPVDLGLITLRGTADLASTAASSFGTANPSNLNTISWTGVPAIDGRVVDYDGHNCTGTEVSRMRVFEGVFQGLAQLEGFRYRYIAAHPLATLDAPVNYSVVSAATGGTSYPSRNSIASTAPDALGKVYIEYVDDKYEFYWDMNEDGVAEYWSVNDTSAYTGTSKGGKVFASSDFLEPNFAYIYAFHCHRTTIESHFTQAVVGVELPSIGRPLSSWIGTMPVYSTNADQTVSVSTNGTALLGIKYLAGATGFRSGTAWGGFIETDQPYFDSGSEVKDFLDRPTDLGKYISIWISPELHDPRAGVNNNRGYVAISPAAYAAFRSTLGLKQSPTHVNYPAASVLTSSLTRSQRANLISMRYTFANQDFNGTKIADSPSASLPQSDYSRQGSMEIVQFVDEGLRSVADPYLGRIITVQEESALERDLIEFINGAISLGILDRGSSVELSITPDDRILGQAIVRVELVVPTEMQRIIFNVSMRRAG